MVYFHLQLIIQSMNKFGLIGFPLEHSFSKKYFDNKFLNNNIKNASYDNYEINDIKEFKDLIKNNPEIKGLNVTIPYKKKIIPFLNKIDSKAKLIGAVNVIKINDFNIDVSQSFMIGDSKKDIEAAKSAGCEGILLKKNQTLLEVVVDLFESEKI